jgi:altronate dehydratase
VLSGAGRGAQQHVALAAAGAHVIVAFPALDDAPVGFAVCPVIAVAGASPLHAAIGDDFDLGQSAGVDELWAKTLAVLGGEPSAAEARGSRVFALERLAMSM